MHGIGQRSGALDGMRGVFLAAPIIVHLGHLDLTVDGTHLGPAGVEALTPWMSDELVAAAAGDRVARHGY